jgi:hypothetical protein
VREIGVGGGRRVSGLRGLEGNWYEDLDLYYGNCMINTTRLRRPYFFSHTQLGLFLIILVGVGWCGGWPRV